MLFISVINVTPLYIYARVCFTDVFFVLSSAQLFSRRLHYRNQPLRRVPEALGEALKTLGKGFAECNTRQIRLGKQYIGDSRLEGGVNRAKLKFTNINTTTSRG
jgi:hypothetical protein